MSQKDNHTIHNSLVMAAIPVLDFAANQQAEAVERLEHYLSESMGITARVVVPQSYEEILAGMERGEIDAARLGPYAFAVAQSRFGARALANAVDISAPEDARPAPYRSVIFTRADSGVTNLNQLKGQTFGFVDRNSTTGYLVATFLLQQAGLDAASDIKPSFLLSHTAVAEAVIRGELTAGSVQEEELAGYIEAPGTPPLRLLAASPLIPKGPVAIHPNLSRLLERKLQTALMQLHQNLDDEAARLISLPTQRFVPAVQRELTLKSIAELAGVSYATVSRAINGRDRIAPATTARILKLVEELGYRPNANARSLIKPKGDLIGLFLPSLSYPGLDELVNGAQTALAHAGMQLVVCPLGTAKTSASTPRQKAYFELAYNSRLEGVLLTQWSVIGPEALELARSGRPAVLLEQDLLEEGLETAWLWLTEQGHQHIGLVTSAAALLEPEISRRTFSRFAGPDFAYLQADTDLAGRLEAFLQKSAAPTALFCTDDQTALSVRELTRERSPQLKVLGFGNSELAHWAGLPSLAFDGSAVGEAAAQRLLRSLDLPIAASNPQLRFWVCTNNKA